MRRLQLAAILLIVAVAAHAQTLGPVDWIFLVDTSKSRRGIGGTKDIWTDVQMSLNSFIDEAGNEDTVTMYAFDRDVRIVDDPKRALFALRPDGNRTHLGAAIAQGAPDESRDAGIGLTEPRVANADRAVIRIAGAAIVVSHGKFVSEIGDPEPTLVDQGDPEAVLGLGELVDLFVGEEVAAGQEAHALR